MPRRVNKRCIECAQMSAAQAQHLHGKQGDGCWREKRCPRRRSHYRNRLNARFGITFFADEIRLEPMECPIEGCPWHDRLVSAQKNHLDSAEVANG